MRVAFGGGRGARHAVKGEDCPEPGHAVIRKEEGGVCRNRMSGGGDGVNFARRNNRVH